MPDIRMLLDDVTERPLRPAPVDAIRTAGRRRRAVRTTALAAVTTVALAAGLGTFALTRSSQSLAPAAPPRPTPSANGEWRAMADLRQLMKDHRDVFLDDSITTVDGVIVLTFAGDADPQRWRADIDRILKPYDIWSVHRCPQTRAHYDKVLAEVKAFHWPDGDRTESGPYGEPPHLDTQFCAITFKMYRHGPHPADEAAARATWGKDVRVSWWAASEPMHTVPPWIPTSATPLATPPSPSSTGG